MWYRSFCGAVGRVVVGLFIVGLSALATVYMYAVIHPYVPAVIGFLRSLAG